jgi:hypothetical protein
MKVNHSILIFLISSLFFSCISEKKDDIHYYHKNFFLGETTFLIQGEATNTDSSLITIISAGSVHYSLDRYSNYTKSWEIFSTEVYDNKFELLVDITANGVTLGTEILSEGIITPMGFPDDFPSCYLVFHPKNNPDAYRDIYTYSKINEVKYYCSFIYVAEPFYKSGTEIVEILQWQGEISKVIRNDIHHYDYSFTQPGWYKIIEWHESPISNDTNHSSVENIYFYEPDRRY